MTCSVCGEAFVPGPRWWEDWCPDCATNFRAADELRVHAEVEAAVLALTPRQVQALARITARQRARQQEEEP